MYKIKFLQTSLITLGLLVVGMKQPSAMPDKETLGPLAVGMKQPSAILENETPTVKNCSPDKMQCLFNVQVWVKLNEGWTEIEGKQGCTYVDALTLEPGASAKIPVPPCLSLSTDDISDEVVKRMSNSSDISDKTARVVQKMSIIKATLDEVAQVVQKMSSIRDISDEVAQVVQKISSIRDISDEVVQKISSIRDISDEVVQKMPSIRAISDKIAQVVQKMSIIMSISDKVVQKMSTIRATPDEVGTLEFSLQVNTRDISEEFVDGPKLGFIDGDTDSPHFSTLEDLKAWFVKQRTYVVSGKIPTSMTGEWEESPRTASAATVKIEVRPNKKPGEE